VEFALVIPVFLTVFFAIVEFSFLFTDYLSIGYASHDGSQLAATMGNTLHADTAILVRINNDIQAPANNRQIKTVDIYQVDTTTTNGSPVSGRENIYTYDGGSHTFTMPDGTTVQLPFTYGTLGYVDVGRCNVNLGIGCTTYGQTTVDTIGVKITYQYTWITPFPAMIGGSGNGPLITELNIMRLEPVL
jgi:Flp pilus assembly protein TadG